MWLRARYMERNLPCCQHSPVLCRRLVFQKCNIFKASLARREPAGESPYYCHITCFVSTARGAASKHSSFAPQTRMSRDRWAGLHSKDASNVPRKCCAMPSWDMRVGQSSVWYCMVLFLPGMSLSKAHGITMILLRERNRPANSQYGAEGQSAKRNRWEACQACCA